MPEADKPVEKPEEWEGTKDRYPHFGPHNIPPDPIDEVPEEEVITNS